MAVPSLSLFPVQKYAHILFFAVLLFLWCYFVVHKRVQPVNLTQASGVPNPIKLFWVTKRFLGIDVYSL